MTERTAQRFWLWYFGLFLALIGLSVGYGLCRGSTLEPVTMSVDVRQPGTYRASRGALRFHWSRYHPAFRVTLSSPTGPDWWSAGDQSLKIWGGTPPQIHLVVRDSTGALVLEEAGPVSKENGWIVTGGGRSGETEVELYKFNEFTASPFRSYTVDLRIVENSPAPAIVSAELYIATIKAYALLPNVFLTMLLTVLMIASAPVVAGLRWWLARR